MRTRACLTRFNVAAVPVSPSRYEIFYRLAGILALEPLDYLLARGPALPPVTSSQFPCAGTELPLRPVDGLL
jgi:hypothetical protein